MVMMVMVEVVVMMAVVDSGGGSNMKGHEQSSVPQFSLEFQRAEHSHTNALFNWKHRT